MPDSRLGLGVYTTTTMKIFLYEFSFSFAPFLLLLSAFFLLDKEIGAEGAPVLASEVEIGDGSVRIMALLGGGRSSRLSGGRSGMVLCRDIREVGSAFGIAYLTVKLDIRERDTSGTHGVLTVRDTPSHEKASLSAEFRALLGDIRCHMEGIFINREHTSSFLRPRRRGGRP